MSGLPGGLLRPADGVQPFQRGNPSNMRREIDSFCDTKIMIGMGHSHISHLFGYNSLLTPF
jgi:hypothetical protein